MKSGMFEASHRCSADNVMHRLSCCYQSNWCRPASPLIDTQLLYVMQKWTHFRARFELLMVPYSALVCPQKCRAKSNTPLRGNWGPLRTPCGEQGRTVIPWQLWLGPNLAGCPFPSKSPNSAPERVKKLDGTGGKAFQFHRLFQLIDSLYIYMQLLHLSSLLFAEQ